MELRAFWSVLVRWRWVVLVVTIAAIVASGALAVISPPGYKARTTLTFSAPPPASAVSLPGFDEVNRFTFSEEAVDDFTKIVPTRNFSDAVAKRLTFKMDPKQIEKVWTIKKEAHHLLSIEASAGTEQRAQELAKAAGDEISQHGNSYDQFLNTDLRVSVLESAVNEGVSGRLLDYLFIVARVVVGLIVGIGLAFLLNYLDDRITGVEEAEALGFRVIGSIPTATNGKQGKPGKPFPPAKITAVGT